ncbi:MAG: J domain-containing protein, partial [Treponema sp.]|nr:J domain-containing protein [Treponema sp.]
EQTAEVKLPPKELRIDFGCLEVPFGADLETCKAAYKNLLKIHHPDHHAGNEVNFKKATTRTARINAAWERIEMWHKGEYIPE